MCRGTEVDFLPDDGIELLRRDAACGGIAESRSNAVFGLGFLRSLNLLLQVVREKVPKLGMRLHEAGNVSEVLDPLALSPFRLGPGLDLSTERIFQRSHAKKYSVNISRNSTGREVAIEILRTELKAEG